MNTKILLTSAVLALTACAAPVPFEESAVPGAQSMLTEENELCVAGLKGGKYQTAKSFVECLAIAKVHFTQAIKLRDDTRLKAYMGRLGTLAGETDAGRVNSQEFIARLTQINKDFNDGLAAAYQINAVERQQAAARAQAFAAAQSQAGAAMQASAPPPKAFTAQAPGWACS